MAQNVSFGGPKNVFAEDTKRYNALQDYLKNNPDLTTDEIKKAYKDYGVSYYKDDRNFLQKLTDGIGITDYKGEAETVQDAQDSVRDAGASASATYDDIIAALGGQDAIKAYVDTLKAANETINGTDFGYDKTVDQFMDPAADYRIDKSVQAAQNALAGQGGMNGGAAARQLQAVASEAASDEYNSAWERMLKDQQITNDVKKAEIEKANTVLGNVKDLSDDTINAVLGQLGTDMNFQQLLAQIQLDNAGSGFWGDVMDAFKGGSEIYSNFKK